MSFPQFLKKRPYILALLASWRLKLLVFALSFSVLSGCGEPLVKQQSYVFGTLVEVSIYGEDDKKAETAAAEVLAEFDRLHRMLHAWKPSELSTVNAAFAKGTVATISPELAGIIGDATLLSQQSGDSFNPAIGKLVELWGFHADEFKPVNPSVEAIATLVRANPRMQEIAIGGGVASSANQNADNLTARSATPTTHSANPAVQLDLGGYAKGYALDRAVQLLRARGIRNALVNIGGNIIALGEKGARPWKVGIQHPRRPGPIATLELYNNEAIGTSGDYQRYFERDGKRYCHIIDPATGYPAQGVEAVTVVISPGASAGALSDADSKPLFIAGVTGWRSAAARMNVNMAMLVDDKGEVYLTQALSRRLEFTLPKPLIHEVP